MKFITLFFILWLSLTAQAQTLTREFPAGENSRLEIVIENRFGQTRVAADETVDKVILTANSLNAAVVESEITAQMINGKLTVTVNQTKQRIDLTVRVPARARLKIVSTGGEVEVSGNLESAEVATDTGTIYADVPLDALKYDFLWTESRPRYLSDVELNQVKEKSAGKFTLAGKFPDPKKPLPDNQTTPENTASTSADKPKNEKTKNTKQAEKDKQIALNFTTKRGVILLNVPPSEAPSDLRERPLTEAAKAVVSSGDSILSEAVRRASPKYFGDYLKNLPPRRATPNLTLRTAPENSVSRGEVLRRITASVADKNGRAVSSIPLSDFTIFEGGQTREIVSVAPATAPFNLILLLDVSGSVEERLDFIRKAARNFINAVSPQDKLALITFRDDVQVLANFTTDKKVLSDSLDTFDAGGGTALYDSLAYSLSTTLRPLRGERTAIVILSDGDDTRSFIPFEPILGAIQESGALIYPLYVPSGLIPANGATAANQTLDPLRSKFLTVTTKADAEAKQLAEISGGAYFPIRRLEDLQTAYDDVIAQLRAAYTITYRSNPASAPRLRITVKQPGTFVKTNSVTTLQPTLRQPDKPAPETNAPVNPETPKPEIKTPGFEFQKIAFNKFAVQDSNVTGDVKAIVYKTFAAETLRELPLENLNINNAPPSFVMIGGQSKFAVSRWVSPKRTRSYPYQRMYDTLQFPKRAAVIPLVKDEGADGERDFLQWDTLSLLNLLEVYTVFGYYDAAKISPRRQNSLIDQSFNNDYVTAKLKELSQSKLSAYEWNLRELKNLKQTVDAAKAAYQKLSAETKVRLHDASGLDNFVNKLSGDAAGFLEFSRQKSQKAQNRELNTDQPKETMPTRTKSRITISDYLGGKYFFTVDEAVYENETLYLIESKHHQGGKLTSTGDIKEGLVKMMVYRNLIDVKRNGKSVKFKPVLRLTANKMLSATSSDDNAAQLKEFCRVNNFSVRQTELVQNLFAEARHNDFLIKLEPADTSKK